MLVLTRKLGEKLVIGVGAAAVVVDVVSVSNGRVRLGIEASADTEVNRHEVYERKYGDGAAQEAA